MAHVDYACGSQWQAEVQILDLTPVNWASCSTVWSLSVFIYQMGTIIVSA